MTKAIAELKTLLRKPSLEKTDVLAIFSRMRILLEENELQAQYPQLYLYCNWCLHSALSASPTCLGLLEELTALLVESADDPEATSNINIRIYEVISAEKLRQQSSEVIRKFGLPSIVFDNVQNWHGTFAVLLTILTEVPIEWPKEGRLKRGSRLQEIHDRAQLKAEGTQLFIRRFEFIEVNNRIYWQVLGMMDHVDIRGPVLRRKA